MQAHQQRVIDEEKDLNDKITRLVYFVESSPFYADLPDDEKMRLNRQVPPMIEYRDVLRERIAAFA
jgi:hypothetical protein